MATGSWAMMAAAAPVEWLEGVFEWLGGLAQTALPDGLVKSLVISGIIDGVGGVMGFVPLIMFMFFGIALLEDSGYLARVAYMLDRVFRLKFRQDQLNEGSEVCPGCGCTRNCTPGRIDANCKNIV